MNTSTRVVRRWMPKPICRSPTCATTPGMGNLLERLGLKRVDADNVVPDDELTPVDLAQMCPPTLPVDTVLDRDALNRKAREMLDGKGRLPRRPVAGGRAGCCASGCCVGA